MKGVSGAVDIWRFSDEMVDSAPIYSGSPLRGSATHCRSSISPRKGSAQGSLSEDHRILPVLTPRGAGGASKRRTKDRPLPRSSLIVQQARQTTAVSHQKPRPVPPSKNAPSSSLTSPRRAADLKNSRAGLRILPQAKDNQFLVVQAEQRNSVPAVDYRAVIRLIQDARIANNTDMMHYAVEEAISSAAALCKDRMYNEAQRLYRAVLEVEPGQTTALCNLGCIVERVDNDSMTAVKLFEAALQVEPDDMTCMINLARALYKLSSSVKQPRLLLRKVLAREPNNTGALVNLALLVLSEFLNTSEEGRKSTAGQEAARLAENLFSQALKSAKAAGDRLAKGLALGNLAALRKLVHKDWEQAEELYLEAIASDPTHAVLRKNLAQLCHEMFAERAEQEEIEKKGRRVAVGDEKAAKRRAMRGPNFLRQVGQRAEAQYKSALALCSASAGPKELMVDVLVSLAGLISDESMGGRWPEALELVGKANELDPGNLDAAVHLASLLWEKSGKLCEAEQVLDTCMERNKLQRELQWGRLRNVVKALNGFSANAVAAMAPQLHDPRPLEMSTTLYFDITAHRQPQNCQITCSSSFNLSETFAAVNAFDDIAETEWASDGEGVGAWVQVRYPKQYLVGVIKVRQRAFGSSAKTQHNRTIEVIMDGPETRQFELEQSFELQELHISPPVLTTLVRIEALSVYSKAAVVNNGFNSVQVWGMDAEAADMDVKFHNATSKIQKFLRVKQQFRLRREAQDSAQKAEQVELEALDLRIQVAKLQRNRVRLSMPNDAKVHQGGCSMAEMVQDFASRPPPAAAESRAVLYEALVALGDYLLGQEAAMALSWTAAATPRAQAERCFEKASELDHARADAMVRLAMLEDDDLAHEDAQGRAAKLSRVEALYQQALCIGPEDVLGLFRYAAFAEDKLQDTETAIRLFRQAEQACAPEARIRAPLLSALGTALHRRGLGKMAQSEGRPATDYTDKSEANGSTGSETGGVVEEDLEEAARWYTQGLQSDPLCLPLMCNLGTLESARGNQKLAFRLYQRALHQYPGDVSVLCNFATLIDAMGHNLKSVRRLYETALYHNPDYHPALAGLGTVLHRQGKLSRAEKMYRRALALQPNNPLVSSNLQELLKGNNKTPAVAEEESVPGGKAARRSRRPTGVEAEPSLLATVRPSSSARMTPTLRRDLSLLGPSSRGSRGVSSMSSRSRGLSRGHAGSLQGSRGQAEVGLFGWGGGLEVLDGTVDEFLWDAAQ